jgi:hypothetical protein
MLKQYKISILQTIKFNTCNLQYLFRMVDKQLF